jgi:hypothetical protein
MDVSAGRGSAGSIATAPIQPQARASRQSLSPQAMRLEVAAGVSDDVRRCGVELARTPVHHRRAAEPSNRRIPSANRALSSWIWSHGRALPARGQSAGLRRPRSSHGSQRERACKPWCCRSGTSTLLTDGGEPILIQVNLGQEKRAAANLRALCRSVRQQDRDRHRPQHRARRAAEESLACARMAIPTHDDQCCLAIGRE